MWRPQGAPEGPKMLKETPRNPYPIGSVGHGHEEEEVGSKEADAELQVKGDADTPE